MAGRSLQFELVPVTSVFNGGAAGKPELLRGPSVKGLILWWVRAMLGGTGTDPVTIHRLIDERFGNQEASSKMSIDIQGPRATAFRRKPTRKPTNADEQLEGLRYLAYGLDERYDYDPDELTGLLVSLRFKDDATLRMCWCGLWLLSRFGGIGARCRRGMGSFHIHQAGDPPVGLPPLEPEDVSSAHDLVKSLTDGLNQVAKHFANGGTSLNFFSALAHAPFATSPLSAFSCFQPGFWRATAWHSNRVCWEEALDELGSAYYEHRRGSTSRGGRSLSRDFFEACLNIARHCRGPATR